MIETSLNEKEKSMKNLKIMIITCTFAPQAGPGSTFIVDTARYMHSRGAEVCVLTLSEEDLLALNPADESLSLPSDIHIQRIKGGLIRALLRKAVRLKSKEQIGRLRKSFFSPLLIPDPYMDCIIPMIRKGLSIVRSWKPDLILSVAYPWSCHVVSWFVARSAGMKWLAYYGDPWAYNPATYIRRSKWRGIIDFYLEKALLKSAWRVIVATEKTKLLYSKAFPFIGAKLDVVRAICHLTPLRNREPEKVNFLKDPKDGRISIIYCGRIYRSVRSADELLRAISILSREYPNLGQKFNFWLIGDIELETINKINKWQLTDIFRVMPWLSKNEIICWMDRADWLLLLGNRGGIQVPSKLYDYIRLRKPILMLREEAADEAAEIISEMDAGWVVENKETSIIRFFKLLLDGCIKYPRYQGKLSPDEFTVEAVQNKLWQIILHLIG